MIASKSCNTPPAPRQGTLVIVTVNVLFRYKRFGLSNREGYREGYSSSTGNVSSMAISLNSDSSKISPQSSHSTYSASSSRETMRTRGCLQDCCMSVLESGKGGLVHTRSGRYDFRLDFVAPCAACQEQRVIRTSRRLVRWDAEWRK